MSPFLQRYSLGLFGNMLQYNRLVVLHTEQDKRNLLAIADHLRMPENSLPGIHIRDLMPPSFVDFHAKEPDPANAPEFMRKAVQDGKTIALILERMDPIKMDPTVLDNLEFMIRELAGSDNGRAILSDLRVAMIARPSNYGDWKVGQMYDDYADFVNKRVHQVNALYREVMQTDDDFLLLNTDANGKLTGYPHEKVKSDVYPFVNIHLQLGQEGLCQTVQEATLTTSFGLEVPRPAVGIVSSLVGFAEKAQREQFPNVQVVDDPTNPHQVMDAFMVAYEQAQRIKENPGSEEVRLILDVMERYYDGCRDSFYAEMLQAYNRLNVR